MKIIKAIDSNIQFYSFFCGSLAGMMSSTVVYPLEFLRYFADQNPLRPEELRQLPLHPSHRGLLQKGRDSQLLQRYFIFM